MKPWDVIIVGAGVTGLSLGRLLGDDGARVLLIDKSHRPGGRLASKTVGGLAFDPGPQKMWSSEPSVQELMTRWHGTVWSESQQHPGSMFWQFPLSAREIAEHWAGGLSIQRSHVTHLVTDDGGFVGVVRHGFGDPIWGRQVVLTAPIPQSQAMIAYSDYALDYALDEVSYRRRQVLLATVEGEGVAPDSHWSTEIIEWINLRAHHEGFLGIEAFATESWSEGTWDEDSTISHGRLLLELGLLLGRARVVDTEVMRWRYAVTGAPHPEPFWQHPDVPGIWMAGDGFGAGGLGPQFSMERAVLSAIAVHRELSARL